VSDPAIDPAPIDPAGITLDRVTKKRGGRTVLHEVGFEAVPGRVTGFLGPNGAGKTSALRVLLGLDRADAGTALVGGRAYRDLPRPLRTVGALLDGSGAHRSRTARAHLRWVAASNGLPRHRVEEVLETVGLAADADRRAGRFSLGMGRRLGLATALLGDPAVLVLDEPTNGLDPAGIRWVRDLVREQAAAGRTVLLSGHQLGELAGIVDDVVVIDRGRIVARGTLPQVTGPHPSLEDAFFALTGPGGPR
jgi:ABC-2 type transport system ATP-binding protein